MKFEEISRDLISAVEEGDFPKVQTIISDIPESSKNQGWTQLSRTPITIACSKGYIQILKFLLNQCHQEDFNNDSKRETLLHLAVRGEAADNYKTVEFLLEFADSHGEFGAKEKYVNIQNLRGETALHLAAADDDSVMLGILFEANADATAKNKRGFLPAHIACIKEKYKAMEWLVKRDPIGITEILNFDEVVKSTCLHLLSERNHGSALYHLLHPITASDIKIRDGRNMSVWDVARRGTSGFFRSITANPLPRETSRMSKASRKSRLSKNPVRPVDQKENPVVNGMVQRFPINMEAASVLVLKDYNSFQYPREFTWKEYSLPKITCYSLRSNHFRGIYALFGKLLIADRIKTQDIKKFIAGFQYEQHIRDSDNQGPVILKLREPSCTVTHGGGPKSFTIAMPYFKVLEKDSIDKWREKELFEKSLHPFISLESSCPSSSLESLKAPYLPLTLDEYCCHALPKSMLDRRNGDQVLTKAENIDSRSKQLLTVCQLWILQCKDGLITVHEPDEESNNNGSKPDSPSWGHDCLTGDAKRYMGIMMSHFVGSLDRRSKTGSGNPILHNFENYIASCAQNVDKYSKRKGRKKFDIDIERDFLHNIDDIRGELGMIKRVILQQEEVWKSFASNAWPEHWPSGAEGRMVVKDDEKRSVQEEDEWQLILCAQTQFDRFRRRIAQLDEDAARMEKSIMAKLDLKQKHASLQESHATAVMSAAVLGFTVITIIFTPLSFLTSLFALSIDHFQRNQVDFFIPNRENEADFANRTRVYTTNYIWTWAATTVLASIAVALLSMWLVIEYGMDVPVLRRRAKQLMEFAKQIWKSKDETGASEPDKPETVREKKHSAPAPESGPRPRRWYDGFGLTLSGRGDNRNENTLSIDRSGVACV